MKSEKPLGHKIYGSIPHLPGSRVGLTDKYITQGQADILTKKTRNINDTVVVQEKLDGSCVGVAKINRILVPLIRAGYRACESHYFQHILFHNWVFENEKKFNFLGEEEVIVGEWLAQAHGTRYKINESDDLFVAFDLYEKHNATIVNVYHRKPSAYVKRICDAMGIRTPREIHRGGPISIEHVLDILEPSGHGALDPVEGAIWRLEKYGIDTEFMAKYVRQDKEVGKYLFNVSGNPNEVWNWGPLKSPIDL